MRLGQSHVCSLSVKGATSGKQPQPPEAGQYPCAVSELMDGRILVVDGRTSPVNVLHLDSERC